MKKSMEELRRILDLLRQRYGSIDISEFIATRIKSKSLFEFMIGVMLSQNTSDRNAIKAYESLKKLLNNSITATRVTEHSVEEIAEAIKPAGMHYQRARRIMELALMFKDHVYVEKLEKELRELPVEEARKKLIELPGIGVKTADVVLLMYFNKPTFPVDTHIARITKRLGYLERYDYESIRRFWMKVFKPSDYLEAHLLLITHGRRTCRARKPLCSGCVIREYCRTYGDR